MGFIKLDIKSLKPDLDYLAINGQFFPGQMSSRLYMRTEDVAKKYQTAFHERFHYCLLYTSDAADEQLYV